MYLKWCCAGYAFGQSTNNFQDIIACKYVYSHLTILWMFMLECDTALLKFVAWPHKLKHIYEG